MEGGVFDLRVGHETVIVQSHGTALHVFASSDCERILQSVRTSVDVVDSTASPISLRDVHRFRALLGDRVAAPWWLNEASPAIAPSALVRGTRPLVEALARIEIEADLARAALISLVTRPSDGVSPKVMTEPSNARYAARALRNELASEANNVDFELVHIETLLALAADLVDADEPRAAMRIGAVERFEIPYGLSPETKATRLEEVIGGARMVALLPFASGAIEATSSLGHGQFLAAGQFAAGGALITVVLSAGVALAERALAWGQQRETRP